MPRLRRGRARSRASGPVRRAAGPGSRCRRPRPTRGRRGAFELAARLGYDGVEVMVWTDPVTQEAGALRTLSEHHGIPVLSVHAPTPAGHPTGLGHATLGEDRTLDGELADELGAQHRRAAPTVPVAARATPATSSRGSRAGAERRHRDRGREHVPVAGAASRELRPTCRTGTRCRSPTTHVTLDLSHTSTSGFDAMEMAEPAGAAPAPPAPGRRGGLARGRAPRARARHPALRRGARGAGVRGVCRARRRRGEHPSRRQAQREADLAEALAFARLHLGDLVVGAGKAAAATASGHRLRQWWFRMPAGRGSRCRRAGARPTRRGGCPWCRRACR